jgi:hypothetical protein
VQACSLQLVQIFQIIIRKLSAIFSENSNLYPTTTLKDGKYHFDLSQLKWNKPGQHQKESEGLYLFVHGLRGSPLHWSKYFCYLNNNNQMLIT